MIISEWTKNIRGVKLQRNYSICLNVFLSALLLLSLLVLVRTAHKHTTILVPVGFSQESLIGTKNVGDSYLIQWTDFIVGLKLNVTPETVAYHQRALLPYISNAAYGKFKASLLKEQERIIGVIVKSGVRVNSKLPIRLIVPAVNYFSKIYVTLSSFPSVSFI